MPPTEVTHTQKYVLVVHKQLGFLKLYKRNTYIVKKFLCFLISCVQ